MYCRKGMKPSLAWFVVPLLLVSTACSTLSTQSSFAPSSPLPAGDETEPPKGLATFCAKNWQFCADPADGTGLPEKAVNLVFRQAYPALAAGHGDTETLNALMLDAYSFADIFQPRKQAATVTLKAGKDVMPDGLKAGQRYAFLAGIVDDAPLPQKFLAQYSSVLSETRKQVFDAAVFVLAWADAVEPISPYARLATLGSSGADAGHGMTAAIPVGTETDNTLQKDRLERTVLPMEDFSAVVTINTRINRQIKPVTDIKAYGEYEYWTMPITMGEKPVGDCEDYALEKHKALIEAGIPRQSLFFATAFSKDFGLHAVLIISTDMGDYVLDNMTSEIRPWHETGYQWISRQMPGDMMAWRRVEMQ